MIEHQKKREKIWKSTKFYINLPSTRWCRNEIHSLLSRADARGALTFTAYDVRIYIDTLRVRHSY